jgi:TRAP-type C4-dicarboxylate transport system substrate-binding protein
MHRLRLAAAFCAATLATATLPAQAQTPLRWLSQSQAVSTQFPIESATLERLGAPGTGLAVTRSEFQALSLNLGDALRLVRSGSFDVVSVQVGLAARDDAFLEGIDLIGVSTTIGELRSAADAYRAVFDKRIQERFGARVLAIWPFGAQVFFCNQAIRTLDDLKGQRVRSFTASMSKLIEQLGATPVSLAFPEVYPALQRGTANCGVTSVTSANTGRWPEVTSHLLPLSISGSMQAHLVNNAYWARLTPAQQATLTAESQRMERELWELATTVNDDATNCSIGREPCAKHARFNMTLVEVAPADAARVRRISEEAVLPEWAGRCERVYPNCKQAWNDTIGRARGMTIR